MFSFKKKIGIKNHIVKKNHEICDLFINGVHFGSSTKKTNGFASSARMNGAIVGE